MYTWYIISLIKISVCVDIQSNHLEYMSGEVDPLQGIVDNCHQALLRTPHNLVQTIKIAFYEVITSYTLTSIKN